MKLKRYAAEFIGTFVIVLCPLLTSAVSKGNAEVGSLLIAALASGLPVMAMIYALGPVSAAHFNPAVTIAFASAKRFPWRHVAPYIASQVLGAVLAAAVVAFLFQPGNGVHVPANVDSTLRNVITEVLLSFMLMLVIISVATKSESSPTIPGLSIGMTVVFCVLVGGGITGGSMNPARSLGPALFGGPQALSVYWIYLIGPIVGAVLAAQVFEGIRLDRHTAVGAPSNVD